MSDNAYIPITVAKQQCYNMHSLLFKLLLQKHHIKLSKSVWARRKIFNTFNAAESNLLTSENLR